MMLYSNPKRSPAYWDERHTPNMTFHYWWSVHDGILMIAYYPWAVWSPMYSKKTGFWSLLKWYHQHTTAVSTSRSWQLQLVCNGTSSLAGSKGLSGHSIAQHHSRKLTWQCQKKRKWRCISYWKKWCLGPIVIRNSFVYIMCLKFNFWKIYLSLEM